MDTVRFVSVNTTCARDWQIRAKNTMSANAKLLMNKCGKYGVCRVSHGLRLILPALLTRNPWTFSGLFLLPQLGSSCWLPPMGG